MTYFELISILENLKTGPRNEQELKRLYEVKIDLSENIIYRIINHINDLIITRIKNTFEGLLIKISTIYYDINALSMEIINIKKELSFAKKIVTMPIIPEENKEKFLKTLENFGDEITNTLISSVEGVDTTGEIITMIKNSRINILED